MDITLYHYDFESDNQNILLFSNATQRDTYFAGISDKKTIQNINFFANDIMQTKVYVRVDDLSLFSLLNYNYAVITNSTGETTQKPLFFYIKNSRQDSGGQIELSLECDIGNTYFYDVDMTKWQAITERCHLDRITQPNAFQDNYVYAYGENSKLYERERVKNCSKRVVQRKPLYFELDKTHLSPFNQWLRDNVSCWKYYFLKLTGNETITSEFEQMYFITPTGNIDTAINTTSMFYITQPSSFQTISSTNKQNSNFVVMCCPIYKNETPATAKNIIKIRQQYLDNGTLTTHDINLTENGINRFLDENTGFSRVLAIKYSILPPFIQECELTYNTDYSVDTDNNLILVKNASGNPKYFEQMSSILYTRTGAGITNPNITQLTPFIHISNQFLFKSYKMKCNLNYTTTNLKWVFTKSELKSSYVEPKMNNEDYSTYRLIIGGQTYDMPISKTSNEPHFLYSEILSPDITKAQLSYDVENSNLVFENYYPQVLKTHSMRDFTGLTLTLDLSMWYPTSELQNYLANNKNYLQIFNNQQVKGMVANLGESAMRGAFNSAVGLSGTGITTKALIGTSASILNYMYDKENLDLTIDNMANSPNNIANINSNAILIMSVQKELSIFIEVLEMLPFEQQTMIDYFKQFGYTYNRLSTIAENLRTRKYYNYIQAQIFEIPEKLGNNVKEKIKQMFANGIRFWHYDTYTGVDFTKNNYERFLDE